jgi:electron transfer flavoprotein-quinone oxidoreductase
MLATGIRVDELLEADGKIVGIKAGEDEIFADVVIAADGVNSFLAQKAGLISDITAHSVGVGAKEIIQLSPEVIQNRFNVAEDEGVARVVLGASAGVPGGGFLYTNKDSISLGMVLNPEELGRSGKKIHELLQEYKMHPAIYPLVKDGTTIEYGAHLVPELGYHGVPKKLYRDGLVMVGDAAGMVINTGTILRGIDLAIVSGVAAARAIIGSRDTGEIGPAYVQELEHLMLLPTMRLYKGFHELMSLPRMFTTYPNMANDMMKFMFAVDGKLPERMDKGMFGVLKNHVTLGQLISDGWKGFKAI